MRSLFKVISLVIIFHVVECVAMQGVSADKDSKDIQIKGDMEFLSEWSPWSKCSRTCGTGIQFRGRKCYRNRRACRIPRQHRTCNNELCPLNAIDFRDVQCSRENSRNITMKGKKVKFKSIFRGMYQCALFCHPVGFRTAMWFGKVQDGTMCASKPYSVCVAGECKPIGCDRIIGSQRTLDKCQVCGGNGSSCEPFSGMVDRKPTPEEKTIGFALLYIIPAHATAILINEPSTNYIAIKRQAGEYVFNGGTKVSSPGKYRIGRTDFKYSRLPDEFAREAVMIMGPTTEPYHVMARLSGGDNVKSDYEYWLPKIIPTSKPSTEHHATSSTLTTQITSTVQSTDESTRLSTTVQPTTTKLSASQQTSILEISATQSSKDTTVPTTEQPTTIDMPLTHRTITSRNSTAKSSNEPTRSTTIAGASSTESTTSETTTKQLLGKRPTLSTAQQNSTTLTPSNKSETAATNTSESNTTSTTFAQPTTAEHPATISRTDDNVLDIHFGNGISASSQPTTPNPATIPTTSKSNDVLFGHQEATVSTTHESVTQGAVASDHGSHRSTSNSTVNDVSTTQSATLARTIKKNGVLDSYIGSVTSTVSSDVTQSNTKRSTLEKQRVINAHDGSVTSTVASSVTQSTTMGTTFEKKGVLNGHEEIVTSTFTSPVTQSTKLASTIGKDGILNGHDGGVTTNVPATKAHTTAENLSKTKYLEMSTEMIVPTVVLNGSVISENNDTNSSLKTTNAVTMTLTTLVKPSAGPTPTNELIVNGHDGKTDDASGTVKSPTTMASPSWKSHATSDGSTSAGNITTDRTHLREANKKSVNINNVNTTSMPTKSAENWNTTSKHNFNQNGTVSPNKNELTLTEMGDLNTTIQRTTDHRFKDSIENATVNGTARPIKNDDSSKEISPSTSTPKTVKLNVNATDYQTGKHENATGELPKTTRPTSIYKQRTVHQNTSDNILNTTGIPMTSTSSSSKTNFSSINETARPETSGNVNATKISSEKTPLPLTETLNATFRPTTAPHHDAHSGPEGTENLNAATQNGTRELLRTTLESSTITPLPSALNATTTNVTNVTAIASAQNVTTDLLRTTMQSSTTAHSMSSEKLNVSTIPTEPSNTNGTVNASTKNDTKEFSRTTMKSSTMAHSPSTWKLNVTSMPTSSTHQKLTDLPKTSETLIAWTQNETRGILNTTMELPINENWTSTENLNVTSMPTSSAHQRPRDLPNTNETVIPSTQNGTAQLLNTTMESPTTTLSTSTTKLSPTTATHWEKETVQSTNETVIALTQNGTTQLLNTTMESPSMTLSAKLSPTTVMHQEKETLQNTNETLNVSTQNVARINLNVTETPKEATGTAQNATTMAKDKDTLIPSTEQPTTTTTITLETQNESVNVNRSAQFVAEERWNSTKRTLDKEITNNKTDLVTEIKNGTTASPTQKVNNATEKDISIFENVTLPMNHTDYPTNGERKIRLNPTQTVKSLNTSLEYKSSVNESRVVEVNGTDFKSVIQRTQGQWNTTTAIPPLLHHTASKPSITVNDKRVFHGFNATLVSTNVTVIKNTHATTIPTTKTNISPTNALNATTTFDKMLIYYGKTTSPPKQASNNNSTKEEQKTTVWPTTLNKTTAKSEDVNKTGIVTSLTDPPSNATSDKSSIPWGPWTPCSRTCGMGFKVRAKLCNRTSDGPECLEKSTQVSLCVVQSCVRKAPSWGPWGPWTGCSSSCGLGVKVRIRSCRNSDVVSKKRSECVGRRFEVEFCRNTTCIQNGNNEFPTSPVTLPKFNTQAIPLASHSEGRTSTLNILPSTSPSSLIRPTPSVTAESTQLPPCQGNNCFSNSVVQFVSASMATPALSSTTKSVKHSTLQATSAVPNSIVKMISKSTKTILDVYVPPSDGVSVSSNVIRMQSSVSDFRASLTSPSSLPAISDVRPSIRSSSTRATKIDVMASKMLSSSQSITNDVFSYVTSTLMYDTTKDVTAVAASLSIHSIRDEIAPSVTSLPTQSPYNDVVSSMPSNASFVRSLASTPTRGESSASLKGTSTLFASPSIQISTISPSSILQYVTTSFALFQSIQDKTSLSTEKEMGATKSLVEIESASSSNVLGTPSSFSSTVVLLSPSSLGLPSPSPSLLPLSSSSLQEPSRFALSTSLTTLSSSLSTSSAPSLSLSLSPSKLSSSPSTTATTTTTALPLRPKPSKYSSQQLSATVSSPFMSTRKIEITASTVLSSQGAEPSITVDGIPVSVTPSSASSFVLSSSVNATGESSGSGKCPPCRMARNTHSLCTSDYAIRVFIENTYMNSNDKPMYKMRILKTFKATTKLPSKRSLRVPGLQCPCPSLETGKEYVIFGKLKTKKTGQIRVMLNRRTFVKEWSGEFEKEVDSMKMDCEVEKAATTEIPTTSVSDTSTKATTLESTIRPPTTTRMATTQPTADPCPLCRLSDNLAALYCSNDYAIRAKVTKYRLATNRTMYYAHVITTYKTIHELPHEVLIRVPGQRCPCPPLESGTEYLIVGRTKATFTGKQRLTLSIDSFVQKWDDSLDEKIDVVRTRCGLPVVKELTTISTLASSRGTTKTANLLPTLPTTIERATTEQQNDCQDCSPLSKSKTRQKQFCKSDQVFHGRVFKIHRVSANRTQYLITMVTAFKSTFELPDQIPVRVADNACLCSQLAVGKELLIFGRVKDKGRGRVRMTLTRKSYIQEWDDSLAGVIDILKTQCEKSIMEVKIKETTVTKVAPLATLKTTENPPSTTGSELTVKETVVSTTTSPTANCPHCQLSYNIHDFCLNEHVLRVRVIKMYHTSANRTVYHVGVKQTYKSTDGTAPIILLRVPGIECHCPKLRVGVEYVVMGLVRRRRKGPSIMKLSAGNFVQRWNEDFEEEVESLRLGCNSSSNVGSFVHLISGSKTTSTTPSTPPITTNKVTTEVTTTPTTSTLLSNSTSSHTPSTENKVTPTTSPKCPPCLKSKRRNKLYCLSDYVLAVQILERLHNTSTHITKYYAAVQHKYKEYSPLDDILVTLIVRNDRCNCPNFKVNASYTLMANVEYIGRDEIRLILPERPFVKVWSKGFHKKMLRLKGSCSTGHKRL